MWQIIALTLVVAALVTLTIWSIKMSKELREAISEEAMFPHGAVNITGIASGFDRNNKDTMGQMEYCIDASDLEYWRIDKDGAGSLIAAPGGLFSDGTTLADRTIVHFPTSGQANFSYWYQGEKITKTTTQVLQLPAATSLYVFYDSSGVLTAQTTQTGHDLIVYESLISYISTHTFEYFADERHGIIMDGETHYNIHYSSTGGFTHHKGGDIAGIEGGVATHGVVANSGFFDEDILVSVDGDIKGDGTLPFIFRFGADSDNVWTMGSYTNLVSTSSGSSGWNELTGGIWGFSVSIGYTYHTFWASNNVIHPVVKLMGQSSFLDRKVARRHIDQEIFAIRTAGLPAPEMQLIGAVIVDNSGDTYKGADGEDWYDYRQGFAVHRYT